MPTASSSQDKFAVRRSSMTKWRRGSGSWTTAGVRQAIAIPGHNYNRADGIAATRRENDAIAAYRDHLPSRFPVAAGVVEPLDEAAGLAEIDRMASELSLKAISFHTEFQGVTIDSPWMMRYLERMGELSMVPLIHASNVVLHEAIWRLGKVARALPDLTIIAIEPFFTYDGMQECFFIADVAPNVVFETASCFDTDLMLDLVRQFGAERLVYGSQYYSQIHPAGEERAHDRRVLPSATTSSRRRRSPTERNRSFSAATPAGCSDWKAGRPDSHQATSIDCGPRNCRVVRHSKPSVAGRRVGKRSSSVRMPTDTSVRASAAPRQ